MRRSARELALQILFQTEFAPQIDFNTFLQVFETTADSDTLSYAQELIQGVISHKQPIDSEIQKNSAHWKLERMSTVDRNILRIATYEIKWAKNPIKENIVINEAIEIAKKYGTNDSGSFVNGILDQIGKQK